MDVDDFTNAEYLAGADLVVDDDEFVDEKVGLGLLVSSGRKMIFNSFSRVIHGVRRLFGFLVWVISIVPGGAEARMRPIVSF